MHNKQHHNLKGTPVASSPLERATKDNTLVTQPMPITSQKQAAHSNNVDIDEQISRRERLLLQMHEGDPNRPERLANLGTWFAARSKRLGNEHGERQAIECLEYAAGIPNSHPKKAGYYLKLQSLLIERFQRLGDIADITKAISHGTTAALVAPEGDPNKLLILINLGDHFLERFNALGDVADLRQSVSAH